MGKVLPAEGALERLPGEWSLLQTFQSSRNVWKTLSGMGFWDCSVHGQELDQWSWWVLPAQDIPGSLLFVFNARTLTLISAFPRRNGKFGYFGSSQGCTGWDFWLGQPSGSPAINDLSNLISLLSLVLPPLAASPSLRSQPRSPSSPGFDPGKQQLILLIFLVGETFPALPLIKFLFISLHEPLSPPPAPQFQTRNYF